MKNFIRESKGNWEIGRESWRINVSPRNHANRPLDVYINGISRCVGYIKQRGEKRDIRNSSRPPIFEPTNEIAQLVGEIIKGDKSNNTFQALEFRVMELLFQEEAIVTSRRLSCIEIMKQLDIKGLTINEIEVDGDTIVISGQNLRDSKGERFAIHLQSLNFDVLQIFLRKVFLDCIPFRDEFGIVRM